MLQRIGLSSVVSIAFSPASFLLWFSVASDVFSSNACASLDRLVPLSLLVSSRITGLSDEYVSFLSFVQFLHHHSVRNVDRQGDRKGSISWTLGAYAFPPAAISRKDSSSSECSLLKRLIYSNCMFCATSNGEYKSYFLSFASVENKNTWIFSRYILFSC
ncbi:hypothetical protein ZIOFF_000184 [Zingiber officinale]|uniref:Uncharacterized protein n=1 Tax=Zingiber officinale TaxID=94328 RepID=A0A8J5IH85_ZINOF|nr:hypothetical protein ZIOFF_000184 [Zingiber officinale]